MIRKCLLVFTIVGLYYVVAVQEELDESTSIESNETYTYTENNEIDLTTFNFNITLRQVCMRNYQYKCVEKMKNLMEMDVNDYVTFRKLLLKTKCCIGDELTLNNNDNNNCQLLCKSSCLNLLLNVCQYNKQFGEPFCNYLIRHPLGSYGSDCVQTCQYLNNSIYDLLNGTFCSEPENLELEQYCEKSCSPGLYGINCENKCECKNGAICDPVNGICSCPAGYTGENCEFPCPDGLYGQDCKFRCNCPHNTACDSIDGMCFCRRGFMAVYCLLMNKIYHLGHLVKNGVKSCDCSWDETACNPLTGECRCKHDREGVCYCKPGWTGYNCRTVCPFNMYYGPNCNSTCKCHNDARCRPTDGICICKKGFFGPTCSEVCPKNYYGQMCLHRCMCSDAETCDPIRGCVCDNNISNSTCISALKLEPENDLSNWLFDISVILSILIISTVLITGIFMCYFCFYQHKIKKRSGAVKNHFELNKSGASDESCNCCNCGSCSTVSGMCDKYDLRDHKTYNLGRPMTYTNEAFFVEYDRVRIGCESSENIYFEIDESTLKPTEDLYDRLDFLRPTGSWKPHYQCTGGNCISNNEKNNTS